MFSENEIIRRYIKQMEQKKMTRDEAVKKLFGVGGTDPFNRYGFVDCLEALGLIKFEEPKSAEQKAIEVLYNHPALDRIAPVIVMRAFNEAGLKIVEK